MFGFDLTKLRKSQTVVAPVADDDRVEERITITRDAESGEWVLEMTPGLDLMEVARVLGVIQSHAIELMQQQVNVAAPPKSPAPPVVDQSLTDTVEF